MKIRINVLLNASDYFKCGDCKNCPIHQEKYTSAQQYEEVKIYCPLGFNSISCPVELCGVASKGETCQM